MTLNVEISSYAQTNPVLDLQYSNTGCHMVTIVIAIFTVCGYCGC